MCGRANEVDTGSTINGYDGSLLNGLQTMTPWQDCECYQHLILKNCARAYHILVIDFGNPTSGRLGLFTAIQNIGGICALFFCEYFYTICQDIVPS